MDDKDARKQAVEAVIRGVAMKTLILAGTAVVAVLVYAVLSGGGRWWLLPASVLFGAGLGLLNFRWLAVAVVRVYLRPAATPISSNIAAVVLSTLKLSFIFIILFIVIKWRFADLFGLIGGLSLCFLAILWEGATMMRNALQQSGQATARTAPTYTGVQNREGDRV